MNKMETNTKVDLDNFDYTALKDKIVKQSFWVVQLENGPVIHPSTRKPLPPDVAPTVPGAIPLFTIYCYDDQSCFRITQEVEGLPKREDLLRKFRQLEAGIRPFLDSLPPPFSWRYESAAEAEEVLDGVYRKSTEVWEKSTKKASEAKARGNAAIKKGDKLQAIAEYTTAIEELEQALTQKQTVEKDKETASALAICHSNRAAAHLMGPSSDLQKSLSDGEASVHYDANYAKGYARQSTALARMGDEAKAMDILAQALAKPTLANEDGLAEMLIQLQTGDQGLSDDEGVFKQWLLDIMINDSTSSDRVRPLKEGAWRRRLDTHMARWKK
ncbi:hypothetical protein HDZ31DRAFT_44842 [Schizophyllum fasciatum]